MSDIKFSPEQRLNLVQKLQTYFDRELEQELEQFDAEFLLDFISTQFGAHYYNQGLADARAIFESKVALIDDEIYAIEKEV